MISFDFDHSVTNFLSFLESNMNVKCGHMKTFWFLPRNLCPSDPNFEVTRCFRYITGTSDKSLKRWDLLCTVMTPRLWCPFSSTCRQKLCKSVLFPKMYANKVVAPQRYDWQLKARENSKTSNNQSETLRGFL